MFNQIFGRTVSENRDQACTQRQNGLRSRIESWRFERDVAAVMSALDRLSDRRLHMIGMRRDDLFESVSDLMMRAEEQRLIGKEVLDLLAAPGATQRASSEARALENPSTISEAA